RVRDEQPVRARSVKDERRHLRRSDALSVHLLKLLLGVARGRVTMKSTHDFLREEHLDLAWIPPRRGLVVPSLDSRSRLEREKLDIAPHQVIGYPHQLAEHFDGRLGYPNVIVQRLGHLLSVAPVAFEQRHCDDALLLLAVLFLQLAANEQIEFLVRAAEL